MPMPAGLLGVQFQLLAAGPLAHWLYTVQLYRYGPLYSVQYRSTVHVLVYRTVLDLLLHPSRIRMAAAAWRR